LAQTLVPALRQLAKAAQRHSHRAGGDHLQIAIPALFVAVAVAREDLLDAAEAASLNAGRRPED
jgi:hypothetical protein